MFEGHVPKGVGVQVPLRAPVIKRPTRDLLLEERFAQYSIGTFQAELPVLRRLVDNLILGYFVVLPVEAVVP